ncbi:hypothetical protein ACTWPF_17255 [Oceanobacillus sp. M65]|uniref:hypothetical protein n=1 Tax=Oceanobacillus sp. M65 TaxID=3457435 RepID=UPI003FCC4E48
MEEVQSTTRLIQSIMEEAQSTTELIQSIIEEAQSTTRLIQSIVKEVQPTNRPYVQLNQGVECMIIGYMVKNKNSLSAWA